MSENPTAPSSTMPTPLPNAALPEFSMRQLEYLVAVADAANWARAAHRLGVSQPALSQGLAELERRLGIKVFEQRGRRRAIRHDVEPIVAQARRMVAAASDLARWAGEYRDAARGRVRLGMIDVAAISYYPDLIRSFRVEHPHVSLRLTVASSANLLGQLADGVLDLIVCVARPDHPFGMTVEQLRTDSLYVIAPPDGQLGSPARWGPWMLFPSGSHTRAQVLEHLGALGAPLEVTAESNQPEVLGEMVQMGLGWSVLPVPDPARFEHAVVGPKLFDRKLVLVTRQDSIDTPALGALAESFRVAPTS